MVKPTLLILAAGMGSRYGGLKQIDRLGPGGETITDYSIFDAIRAGFGKVVVVIRKDIEDQFREFFDKFSDKITVEYVFQELDKLPEGYSVPADRQKPWGTGHAIMMASNSIKEPFAVINADDFYGAEAYQIMVKHLISIASVESNDYCMVGYPLINTLSDYGSVSRGVCGLDEEDFLKSIVERTKIEKTENGIEFTDGDNKVSLTGNEIVSMNFLGFTPTMFNYLNREFKKFLDEKINVLKSEFYIPSVVDTVLNSGEASMKVYKTNSKWFGITYREDRENVVNSINKLIEEGAYPEKLWG